MFITFGHWHEYVNIPAIWWYESESIRHPSWDEWLWQLWPTANRRLHFFTLVLRFLNGGCLGLLFYISSSSLFLLGVPSSLSFPFFPFLYSSLVVDVVVVGIFHLLLSSDDPIASPHDRSVDIQNLSFEAVWNVNGISIDRVVDEYRTFMWSIPSHHIISHHARHFIHSLHVLRTSE